MARRSWLVVWRFGIPNSTAFPESDQKMKEQRETIKKDNEQEKGKSKREKKEERETPKS